jgi:hypothetical protein
MPEVTDILRAPFCAAHRSTCLTSADPIPASRASSSTTSVVSQATGSLSCREGMRCAVTNPTTSPKPFVATNAAALGKLARAARRAGISDSVAGYPSCPRSSHSVAASEGAAARMVITSGIRTVSRRLSEERFQRPSTRIVAELEERLFLDLPHSLARDL